jgi:hypothetical protein
MLNFAQYGRTFAAVMLLIGAALAGCSAGISSECGEERDAATGTDFEWCGDTSLAGSDALRGDSDLITLRPVRARVGTADSYFVRLHYQGRQWAFIPAGSQLTLTVDGTPTTLISAKGSRADAMRWAEGNTGRAAREAADYGTDATTIRNLARARLVTVQVTVLDKSLEAQLLGPNLAPFQQFVRRYLD